MRLPRFTIVQLLLAAALCGLVLGLTTSSWRAAMYSNITYLTFSPSGKHLAAKYGGGAIQVWNVAGDRPRLVGQFPDSGRLSYDIAPIQFADDETLIILQNQVTGGNLQTVARTFDLRTRTARVAFTLPTLYTHTFAASGKTIASVNSNSGNVDFHNRQTGRQERSIRFAANAINLTGSADGQTLIANCQDGSMHVIEWNTGKTLRALSSSSTVAAPAVDGRFFAFSNIASSNDTVEVLDLDSPYQWRIVNTGLSNVVWVALAADGKRLAAADYEAVEYYDAANGKLLKRIEFHGDGADLDGDAGLFPVFSFHIPGQNLALSPDGTTLASFSGGRIALRDLPSGKVRHRITGGWRSLQILIFTVGFGLWAAAWGIVSRRQRLRQPASMPLDSQAAAQLANSRPVTPMGQPPAKFTSGCVWMAVFLVLLVGLMTMEGIGSFYEVTIRALITVALLVPAAILIGVVYSWIVGMRNGPHYFALKRLRQITYDQGRVHQHGNLTVAFFGSSHIEADHGRHVEQVLARASELFGQPVTFERPALLVCLDRQTDLDAFVGRHVPFAAVVPNAWTARMAVVCEETALANVHNPADAFRGALALLLTIRHKRGLPPGWTSTLFTPQIARGDQHASGVRSAIRRLRVRLARQPDWDPRPIFLRTNRQRSKLWLNLDEAESWREVQAEIDVLSTIAEMLLGTGAPADRRDKVLAWLRALRPKDDPLATLQRDVGLSLDDLIGEWRAWLAARDGLPYDPLPPAKARRLATYHLPILWNRTLSNDARARAVRQLGNCGGVAASGALIDLLDDPRCLYRTEVVAALESLSGKLLGDDEAAWQLWHESLPVELRNLEEPPIVAALAEPPLEATVVEPRSPDPFPPLHPPRQVRAPLDLRLCWGLMVLGGLTALAIPITAMFLSGPLLFPTFYYGLIVGVLAIARGAARDTLGLNRTATLQMICLIACDPINLLFGSMEQNLLRRPHVRHYLLQANGGRL